MSEISPKKFTKKNTRSGKDMSTFVPPKSHTYDFLVSVHILDEEDRSQIGLELVHTSLQ